jgi:HlyD family secretion protein
MKQYLSSKLSKRGVIALAVLLMLGGGYYYYKSTSASSTTATTALIAQKVQKGSVTTGIQTTGKIQAAEILDLNVYKQQKRITSVSAQNGTHVEKGTLLYSFDNSDVAVSVANSQLGVQQAQLNLAVQKQAAADPNTTATTLKNDIANLTTDIEQSQKDLKSTLRTYLNADLEAKPTPDRVSQQALQPAPTVGGLYTSQGQGVYTITVYASAEISGFSFSYSGLENGVSPVYLGKESPLGTRGLTLTFPASALNISARDTWVVAVPNVNASTYVNNKQTYDQQIESLNTKITTDKVTLANKQTALAQALRTDTTSTRDLSVKTAALAINQAQVNLSTGVNNLNERRIIAPFSGTIEGVQNIVVGATPTSNTNDTTNFGNLISDQYEATFSLGAADVAKVSVGQSVLVTLSSAPGSAPLHATVTEVSSLPDTSAVPQYSVTAALDQGTSTPVALRDGMLADIQIVQQQHDNVVQVPVSALTYRSGKAYVQVLENPATDILTQLQSRGVARVPAGTVGTEREVKLDLRGTFYVEVTSGLNEGDYIIVTTNTTGTAAASVVNTRGFGGGGDRPPSSTNTTSDTTNAASARSSSGSTGSTRTN